MGSIGIPELVMIFVVALLLFGPRKLPDIGRSIGKALGEFRRASHDLQRSLEDEVAADELRAVKKEVTDAARSVGGDVRSAFAVYDEPPLPVARQEAAAPAGTEGAAPARPELAAPAPGGASVAEEAPEVAPGKPVEP